MATFQGFGLTNQAIERERLEYASYFSSMTLAVYDNILGPTVLKVWVGKQASNIDIKEKDSTEPSDESLLMISSFSIKDEVGRENKISGIETKFYALERINLIACSFVFRAPLRGGKLSVFSFFVTLPFEELSQFMPRYSLCNSNVCRLLSKHLIERMELNKEERPLRVSVKDQVADYLPDFKTKLSGLCQIMLSVKQESLPVLIRIEHTFFGADLAEKQFPGDFLVNAITCHLQLGGHSVVFGDSKDNVNKMINTLALFLTEKERKLCRSATAGKRYIADLYLQGYIKKSDGTPPFGLDCLWRNRFPTTVIDVEKSKVYYNESTVSAYLRRRSGGERTDKPQKMLEELQVFDKGRDGRIIKDYIWQLQQLPESGGVREAFTEHFIHALRLKAISICKYLESELISNFVPIETDFVQTEGAAKVNKDVMMSELGFGDSHMDHLVLLCYAEKMRPGSYLDAIGDPQKDIEKILTDLEFV